MKLSIRSLEGGVVFEDEARALNTKTAMGEITVLDHHLPLISILEKGNAIVTKSSGEKVSIPIQGGFLAMNHTNQLLLLID